MLHHVGAAVYKRATGGGEDGVQYELPPWTVLVLLADLILFLPLILFVEYTVEKVYPVLAIVEDENPPAYEPVALNAAAADENDPSMNKNISETPKPVSSSIRGLFRLLRANGGFKASFRGFFCLWAQTLMTLFLMGIFSGILGGPATPFATLLASLTLVQFSTAWVHIIITKPSPLHFWSRLPPFKRTFDATWKPVTMYWAATELARWVPTILASLIGLDAPDVKFNGSTRFEEVDGSYVAKIICVAGVAIACALLVIPARVVLLRVQSSLLPVEDDTIIPFDRSFGGKVEPAIVTGRGYATISDAWTTFTKAAWRRLVVLYAKIFLVGIGAGLLMSLVIVPEVIFIVMSIKKVEGPSDL